MAAAAAEMGGRVLRKRGNIPLYQKRNMQEYFRNEGSTYTKWYGEGSTYTNWYANWRQFCAQVSDASSECPNIRVPMFCVQTVKKRDLAAPQPNLSGCADRKMVILYV